MASQFYLARSGQQYGPYNFEQLRQFAAEGRLMPDDMLAGAGERHWLPAGKLPGLEFLRPPPIPLAAAAGPERAATALGACPANIATQPLAETCSAVDAAMGLAIVVSVIFWLFIGGRILLALTGAIWLAAGVRIAMTGRIPDTKGRLHYRSHYRLLGGLLAAVGLIMGTLQLLAHLMS